MARFVVSHTHSLTVGGLKAEVIKGPFRRGIRRGHIIDTVGNEDFQKRITRHRAAERVNEVKIPGTILGAIVPWTDRSAGSVSKLRFPLEIIPNVVVKQCRVAPVGILLLPSELVWDRGCPCAAR